MKLKEFFYFNDDSAEQEEDLRYNERDDDSPLKTGDTRKTRLTLKQINRIRKASDAHKKEKIEDLGFIRQMYGIPPEGADV